MAALGPIGFGVRLLGTLVIATYDAVAREHAIAQDTALRGPLTLAQWLGAASAHRSSA
jgi:hypothetical protein